MNHLQDVPLAKAYLLLNHGPSTIVTSEHEGVANVMAAAWVMPLDFDPPKLMLVLDRNTWSRHLVEGSGAFVIQLPSRRQAELTLAVGSSNGSELDKFARHDIATARARQVQAPIVEGCLAYLECKVIAEPHNQEKYDLFIAEVVAAYADERVFSKGRWHFPDEASRTIHYQAGGAFFATGEAFQVVKAEA
ncbi:MULTISPECIES: flavin reductase family protein [Pseudomonas]|uniref:flavin reductase family protein n=1 Tax=Pseudomonas TaxID=286 RepID=UPI0004D9A578|nr:MULTISPECIES: flavin reductase family protein [Pseudomonas]KES20173.1 flavin reductase [Pseudomonas sp. AAC]MBH3433636.1 flavin reductase family protein [Pseudomonas citronellolis]OHR87841.1 flavin reductase [Pseudomonas sp. HMSC75E02]